MTITTHDRYMHLMQHLLGEDRIRTGFTHADKRIQMEAFNELNERVSSGAAVSEGLIEEALTHENEEIRHCASLMEVPYTAPQIDRGLKDGSERVRRDFACFTGFTPTPEQWAKGFGDPSSMVRVAMVSRNDIQVTHEQLDTLLSDKSTQVRCTLLDNNAIHLTSEQVDRQLRSKSATVRETLLKRMDFSLSKAQMARFNKETNVDVLEAFIKRKEMKLSLEQIDRVFDLALGFMNQIDPTVREVLTRTGDSLRGGHTLIALVERNDFYPTEAQAERLASLPSDLWQLKRVCQVQEARWTAERERQQLRARADVEPERAINARAL
jgi:hypothetical protein